MIDAVIWILILTTHVIAFRWGFVRGEIKQLRQHNESLARVLRQFEVYRDDDDDVLHP